MQNKQSDLVDQILKIIEEIGPDKLLFHIEKDGVCVSKLSYGDDPVAGLLLSEEVHSIINADIIMNIDQSVVISGSDIKIRED